MTLQDLLFFVNFRLSLCFVLSVCLCMYVYVCVCVCEREREREREKEREREGERGKRERKNCEIEKVYILAITWVTAPVGSAGFCADDAGHKQNLLHE